VVTGIFAAARTSVESKRQHFDPDVQEGDVRVRKHNLAARSLGGWERGKQLGGRVRSSREDVFGISQ